MMRSFLVILCIAIFSASILILSDQHVHAEQSITVSSIGLDSTSIVEFKNNIDNNFNIKSVKIWLSKDNSFKSFKTEKGWTGKFEVGGQMLVFSSQNSIKPGESVKFGVKTNSENPIINWKALDVDSETLQSAAIVTRQQNNTIESDVVQPQRTAINDNSSFKFIPERPSIGSDFRIVGTNFIPDQSVDFYIDNQMIKSIKINSDGSFVSTSTIPDNTSEKRTEFSLIDNGGTKKINSFRLSDNENREVSEDVKISISHTSKTVKRGEVVTIKGNATPDSTLTITSKYTEGGILSINTINVNFEGKWSFEHLFPNDLKLGKMSIEITDGKSTIVRGFEVISSKSINISSLQNRYEPGDTIRFVGTALPNQIISLVIEDPVGVEIFSKTVTVDESGDITFDVDTDSNFMEGTYVLKSFQGNESVVSVVGVGENPVQILLVDTSQLNYSVGEDVDLTLNGKPNSSVSIVVLDESAKTKISDTVVLDENGNYVFYIKTSDIGTGSFAVEVRHGNSRGDTVFTVGLSTGSGPIIFQTIKNDYLTGEQVVMIGNTGNNVLLNVEIVDPNGDTLRTFETFSDSVGTFKVDQFRTPSDAVLGTWTVIISSDANITKHNFNVIMESDNIILISPNSSVTHNPGEILEILGKNARVGASIFISIINAGEMNIDELVVVAKSSGEFYTIWQIPDDLESGTYKIIATDNVSTVSELLIIN